MDPSDNDRALSTQCRLKNASNEKVDDFVRRWNRKDISGRMIQCKKEEDELELCNKFQFGCCPKSSDICHWEHILCTANGTCASTCPYGHESGIKSRDTSQNSKSNYHSNCILI